MQTLIVATRNPKKLREIVDLLRPYGIAVQPITDVPGVPETVEDGETFAANAAKKAVEAASQTGRWALGEDSGLCVDALGGRPGIYTARYAGEHATDEQNRQKLLAELAGVPDAKRTARYVCSVAVADPQGQVRLTGEATCGGRIASDFRGAGGFGYDPCFFIPEYHATFGELPSVVKCHLSHRARALERLGPKISELLRTGGGEKQSVEKTAE